jgi:hypothetical protein
MVDTITISESFWKNNFCDKCLFLFENSNTISNAQGDSFDNINITNLLNTNSKDEKLCKFCYGILNADNFSTIVEKIKMNINDYDHTDYKLTTNFSPLFEIIHSYVKDIFNIV